MTANSRPWRAVPLAAGVLLMAAAGAFAQSSSTQTLDKFSYEATLPFTSIGFAGTPDIPANVVQSIQGGALEVRQSVEYIRATNLLRVKHFLVAPGAPNPTPAAAQVTPVDEYLVAVRTITPYTEPNSLMITGSVDRVIAGSPFGRLVNSPVVLITGYTLASGETAAGVTNSTLVIPGRLTTFIARSGATVTFGTTTTPGGTDGPVADAGPDITTAQSEITLDGTRSTAPNNGTLTYQWRVVQGAANILEANTARPRVQLAQNFAEYIFELTVTDPTGKTATDQVKVTYSGRF